MNAIFTTIFILSVLITTFFSPNAILSSMLVGTEKGLNLSIKLVVIYACWLGIFQIMNDSGLSQKISKLLKPLTKLIYGNVSEESQKFLCLNMSSNVLGMSGIATPMGIKAVESLEKESNQNAINMLIVVTSTSLQILPTTVIALRESFNSVNATSIFLPSLLSTLLSTICGILLVKVFTKK